MFGKVFKVQSSTGVPQAGSGVPVFRKVRPVIQARLILILFLEQILKFAGLVHFHHDVAAADKFALDVQLWNRGPLAEFFDAFAKVLIFEDIDTMKGNLEFLQDRGGPG